MTPAQGKNIIIITIYRIGVEPEGVVAGVGGKIDLIIFIQIISYFAIQIIE